MAPTRSVVITGASRGLGLASARRLYDEGWTVVAAMRSVRTGLENLRAVTGAEDGDTRLVGVQLDLTDPASVQAAAESILATVGAPYGLVHNAGISAAGMVEETPLEVWERMFATNIFGPVALTRALLPSMRAARRGRIVLISSQAGARGMPATAAYSAVKGAMERWGESMAGEIAAFGIGVTILVTGTYDTEIITDAGATDVRDLAGPYAAHHQHDGQAWTDGDQAVGQIPAALCRPPEQGTRRQRTVRATSCRPRRANGHGHDAIAAIEGSPSRLPSVVGDSEVWRDTRRDHYRKTCEYG